MATLPSQPLLVRQAEQHLLPHRPVRMHLAHLPCEEEAAVYEALQNGRPVLLTGDEMVGKTTVAARVLLDHYGEEPCGSLSLTTFSTLSAT